MDAKLITKANELARELAGEARTIEDLNGVIRSLMKSALERMLNTELESHLDGASATTEGDEDNAAAPKVRNRKNGTSPKTVQGDLGRIPLDVPRDREGTFEPVLLPKHQRRLA